MTNQSLSDRRLELINTARNFYQQGWMVGTAGNLSVRLPDDSFWITASGRNKGELLPSDFVRIYPDGKVEKFLRPQVYKWISGTTYHSSSLDIFKPNSATELVYNWLWDDLKRVGWVEGLLGSPVQHW